MQVEFQAFAYKTEYGASVQDMLKGVALPWIYSDDFVPKDWVKIGTCRVIVEFDDENTIVANQIEALKKQLHTVRAENEMRERAVINKIKNLEALTYESKE